MRADLVGAFLLLTRLPVGRWAAPTPRPGAWAWPLVGAVVGLLGGAAQAGAVALGASRPLAAVWTLIALVLLTGGLHEDGLADTADGFGGGATPARKLEIMRDSRIGSFGALALILGLGLRLVAIAGLGAVLPALVLAGALGRAAMFLPLLGAGPARTEGMAAGLSALPAWQAAVGLLTAALCALLLLPVGAAVLVLAGAAASGWGMTRLALRQIGGHTGDVLGATELVAECVVLTLVSVVHR